MKGFLIEINKETWWFRTMECYNRHMDEIKQLKGWLETDFKYEGAYETVDSIIV